jgi:hypothetical protein
MTKATPPALRPETLKPFALGWVPPTPDEIGYVLDVIRTRYKLKQRPTSAEIGALVGLASKPGSSNGSRTFRRWMSKTDPTEIPYAAWFILCYEADIWPNETTIWPLLTMATLGENDHE